MKTLTIILLASLFLIAPIKAQELSSEEIFKRTNDAVVVIYAYDFNGEKKSQGSGVILSEKGIVVTNFHVFAGNEKLEIKHKDSVINFTEIVGIDIDKDILIIQIGSNNFPNIPVGKSQDVQVGQKVYAIGSPLGFENTMSDGIISGIRSIGKNKKEYLQFTASLSPGSSGGAVLNSKGELIGISSMTYSEGQNINFAIKMDDVMGVSLGEYKDKVKLEAMNYFFKAQQLNDDGKYSEAVSYYTKYLKIFPKDPKAFNYRGIAYENHKEFENAIDDFTAAIKIDPKFSSAYLNRGECYYKLKDFENASKDFSYIIKNDPENIDSYYARGLIFSQDQDWENAVKDFTKVIKKEPYYLAAYLNRGIAYFYDKEYELAIIDFKKCISLDASLAPTLNPIIDQADVLWQYNIK